MVFLLPSNFWETSVSEVASIFACFQFRVFARHAVATNSVSISRLNFFIEAPLRSICHSYLYASALARASCENWPAEAKRGTRRRSSHRLSRRNCQSQKVAALRTRAATSGLISSSSAGYPEMYNRRGLKSIVDPAPFGKEFRFFV